MTASIQTYRIKVSDPVMCTIHQDASTGNILDVVFTADNGKGCPITSTIGSVEGISIEDIRKAETMNMDIVENWEKMNEYIVAPIKEQEKKDAIFKRFPMLQIVNSWRYAMGHALLLNGQNQLEYICSVIELLQGFVNEHKKDGETLA